MTRSRTPRLVLSLGAVAVLALAACGDDDDNATDVTTGATVAATAAPAATQAPAATAAPAATEAPAATPAGTAAPATGDVTVATADTDLGTILVDGDGMTLYLFVPDAQGATTCTGDCLSAWPALIGPATAGDGADEGMLGTTPRPEDGAEQVTYNGWPLYHFGGDTAAGDVNGQGLGDNWYVVDASGNAIEG